MSHSFLYVTTASGEEAAAIGRALVSERLAACANVLPGITSLYWWEGSLQEENEAVLVAKTRNDLVEAAINRIKKLHSYDCPCVVALPISEGNADFLDWIDQETGKGG